MESLERRVCKIKFVTEMLGTVPKDPEVYRSYVETKKPVSVGEDESLSVEKIEEKGWTGFHKDEKGLFVYDYMIKGFFKNAGNVLKERVGIKNLRGKIDDYIFIFPRKIYLGVDKPDGSIERPLRAMTMQGPRVSLARSDYINGNREISFEIGWIALKGIDEALIRGLLEYGKLQGLGQFRNGGYGRFEVTEWEKTGPVIEKEEPGNKKVKSGVSRTIVAVLHPVAKKR